MSFIQFSIGNHKPHVCDDDHIQLEGTFQQYISRARCVRAQAQVNGMQRAKQVISMYEGFFLSNCYLYSPFRPAVKWHTIIFAIE